MPAPLPRLPHTRRAALRRGLEPWPALRSLRGRWSGICPKCRRRAGRPPIASGAHGRARRPATQGSLPRLPHFTRPPLRRGVERRPPLLGLCGGRSAVETPPARRCPAAQGARQRKPHRATRQGSLPPLRHARRPSPQGGVEPNPFLLGLQGRHATASSSPATEDRPGCRPYARGDRPGAEGERASERHGFAATWPGHAGDAPAAGPERD